MNWLLVSCERYGSPQAGARNVALREKVRNVFWLTVRKLLALRCVSLENGLSAKTRGGRNGGKPVNSSHGQLVSRHSDFSATS